MSSPYELLAGLALLREKKKSNDDSGEKNLESWAALLVRLGEDVCVIRQDEVDEILTQEKLTSVAGVAPWMVGVGYFRGKLLYVIDSAVLFACDSSRNLGSSVARVLVIKGEEEFFGVRVDELLGIRHVWSDSTESVDVEIGGQWLGYAEQWIKIEDDMVPVVQIKQLMLELERSGSPEAALVTR